MTTARKNSALVSWLHDLLDPLDRGRLAALRRGLLLEPHQFFELYSVVPPWVLEGLRRDEIARRLMVAILFAFHPCTFTAEQLAVRSRNLGESLRMLAQQRSTGEASGPLELPEPLKRRMDALLAAHPEDLFEHLRHVIRLLKVEMVEVDWDKLLWDLRDWDKEDRRVQWQWSRSFYVGYREAEGGEGHVS